VGLHSGSRNLGCTSAGTLGVRRLSCISGMIRGSMTQGKLQHTLVDHKPMHSLLPHRRSSHIAAVHIQADKPGHNHSSHRSNGTLDGNRKKSCLRVHQRQALETLAGTSYGY